MCQGQSRRCLSPSCASPGCRTVNLPQGPRQGRCRHLGQFPQPCSNASTLLTSVSPPSQSWRLSTGGDTDLSPAFRESPSLGWPAQSTITGPPPRPASNIKPRATQLLQPAPSSDPFPVNPKLAPGKQVSTFSQFPSSHLFIMVSISRLS